MPVGSSIMLNPEAYYAGNIPTVCLGNFTTSHDNSQTMRAHEMATAASTTIRSDDLCNHR